MVGVNAQGTARRSAGSLYRAGTAVLLLCGVLAFVGARRAWAQDQPAPDQKAPAPKEEQSKPAPPPTEPIKAKRTYMAPKYEISGGYAYRRYYAFDGATLGMKGFYGSFDYNLKTWLGVEAEITATNKNEGIVNNAVLGDTHIYTGLAGARIDPLGYRKLTPFGHILVGEGFYTHSVPTVGGLAGNTVMENTLVWEGGGGLEYSLSPHWGVRVIQVDFGPANYVPATSTFTNRDSLRFSFGFTYRFGER
jgi:hypothetical protein